MSPRREAEVGWNEALRFLLELAALAGIGALGWWLGSGVGRWVLGLGLALVAAVVWGTFRVPGDPGDAAVVVPGGVRLMIEAVFFAAGLVGFAAQWSVAAAVALGVLVVVHYGLAAERIRWLLNR